MADDAITDAKVAIAVLETKYDALEQRVGEVRDEMRSGMAGVNTKLDGIATQLLVQKETGKMRARLVAFASHGLSGVTTTGVLLAAAKLLHLPVNIG